VKKIPAERWIPGEESRFAGLLNVMGRWRSLGAIAVKSLAFPKSL